MYRFLRLAGFSLSFLIVATVLYGQLTSRPSIAVALQLEEGQARLEKPSRMRIGRVAEIRRMPRVVGATFA